jgi:hypothetical protein
MIAIAHQFAIDEDGHVLPEPALVVKYVPARPFVQTKVAIEHLADRRPGNLERGTRQVALDVLREPDGGHNSFT